MASLVSPADMPALQRLHDLYDERERALRGYRKERVVTGSMVQAGNIGLIKTVSESISVLNDGVPSLLASTLFMAAALLSRDRHARVCVDVRPGVTNCPFEGVVRALYRM